MAGGGGGAGGTTVQVLRIDRGSRCSNIFLRVLISILLLCVIPIRHRHV